MKNDVISALELAISIFDSSITIIEGIDQQSRISDGKLECRTLEAHFGKLKAEISKLSAPVPDLESKLHEAGKHMVRLCALRN